MKTYHVTEVVVYKVEAESEEAAIGVIVQADDLNDYFHHVEDRDSEEVPG